MLLSIEQKLPTELLEQVLSLVSRDCLCSLCLTSRTFNRIATPRLYSEIQLKETKHLPAFAYVIFTSPAHAALVKSLVVADIWANIEERICDWSWPRPEDPVHRILKAKCAECTSSEAEADKIFEQIQSAKNEEFIKAFLLASLPKLRRLNVSFNASHHDDFCLLWPKIMNGIRSRCDSLAEVTRGVTINTSQAAQLPAVSGPIDVMVTGPASKYSNYTLHLANFFHLPNARSIYGWKHGDAEVPPDVEHPLNPFAKLQPRSCPVEYVKLRCSKLHKDHLQLMLDATIPGKLKTFSYEVGGAWSWCCTEHPAIMKCLQPHHETLEVLGLSHEDDYPYQSISADDKPLPCSFTSFVALKRLKIAPAYIWGHQKLITHAILQTSGRRSQNMLWSALPRNLEELWITRAQNQNGTTTFVPDCLLPALDLVVLKKQSAFPKLHHLRIEFPLLEWKDEWLDKLVSLCQLAAVEGIRTTIIVCDMFDNYGPFTIERPWGWNEDIEWEPEPSKYSGNRECAKVCIDATQQEYLAEILKDMKVKFREEKERYHKARDAINQIGLICGDCQMNNPECDASRGIGFPERFVDERLQKEPYWKGRGRETIRHPDGVTS